MLRDNSFESSIQKIGSIITEQYNIKVQFEGNRLYTDGQTIILPAITDDLTLDEKLNIHACLDHQVGHVRFSDPATLYQGETKFHQDLLMMAEDIRIEALMMEDFPGTESSFNRLNEILRDGLISKWNHLSMASRLVAGLRDAILGRPTVNDPRLQQALVYVQGELASIPECGTTQEIKKATDKIANRLKSMITAEPPVIYDPLNNQLDKEGAPVPPPPHHDPSVDPKTKPGAKLDKKTDGQKDDKTKPSPDQSKTKPKSPDKNKAKDKNKDNQDAQEKTEGEPEEGQEGQESNDQPDSEAAEQSESGESESQDGETQDGEAQDGEAQEGEAEGQGQEGEPQDGQGQEGDSQGEGSETESQDASDQNPGQGGADQDQDDGPLESSPITGGIPESGKGVDATTAVAEKTAEQGGGTSSSMGGGQIMDVPTDVESMVRRQVQQRSSTSAETNQPDHGNTPTLPSTTRFDTVVDHNKTTDRDRTAELRRRVEHMVQPVKRALERIMKVQENERWAHDRERGGINTRALTKLITQPGYRTPFKAQLRNDTKNISFGILIDLSGSYCALCGHRECEWSTRVGGEQLLIARDAAMAMTEALIGLEIPCEVTGFNSLSDRRLPAGQKETHLRWTERLEMHVFKGFESKKLDGFTKMEAGKNNPTGEALIWAAKRLANQKSRRKVLLVLSNGVPTLADQPKEVGSRHLATMIGQVAASGIEVVGIGIQANEISTLFPDSVCIDKIEDLPNKCLTELQKILLKGSQTIHKKAAGNTLKGSGPRR